VRSTPSVSFKVGRRNVAHAVQPVNMNICKYSGIDAETRNKMDAMLFVEGEWEHKLIEWKFNKGDKSGAR